MSGKLLVNPPPDAEDWLTMLDLWLYHSQLEKPKVKVRISGILGIEPIDNPYDFKQRYRYLAMIQRIDIRN